MPLRGGGRLTTRKLICLINPTRVSSHPVRPGSVSRQQRRLPKRIGRRFVPNDVPLRSASREDAIDRPIREVRRHATRNEITRDPRDAQRPTRGSECAGSRARNSPRSIAATTLPRSARPRAASRNVYFSSKHLLSSVSKRVKLRPAAVRARWSISKGGRNPSPHNPKPARRNHLIKRQLAAAGWQRRVIYCARPVDVALGQDVEIEQKIRAIARRA